MKVAYIVEGSTDRAVLHGLRDRSCPGATLHELPFRGTERRRRHYKGACAQARLVDADVLVVVTDANGRDWKKVTTEERNALPNAVPFDTIVGVCDRNVECWLCADTAYTAQRLGSDRSVYECPDPKGAFETALRLGRDAKRKETIGSLVRDAPLRNWTRKSPSFRAFYEDARDIALRRGCVMPNEAEGL